MTTEGVAMSNMHRSKGAARVGRKARFVGSATVVATAASLALAGCSAASTPAAKAPKVAAKHITIALVPGLTTDPFYITMHAGAAAEAKKLGVKLTWQGGTTFSPTTQLPVVNSLLAEHPSALLIAPTDVVALKAPIEKFIKAGIPVITVDTTLKDTSILAARITSNNYQGGEQAAETIAKLAHYTGQVAVDNVNPGISTTDARQAGFIAQIKKYPKMSVAAIEYNNDSPTLAASQTKDMVLKFPKLVGIFGTNIYGAQGAGEAIASAGKKGKIFVAAYDAEPATVKLLKQGVINVLVIQQPALEGADGVKYAYDILTGHKSAVPKSTLVKNVVGTTANASSKSISKYFYLSSFSG
ncbi:MAG TPA: ABC transporter substrate-binding protein [Acidimicrobiales bacterium]|nr:ABC transporter substrate-binding protein [Acidimicrobiales bacterium]